MVGNDHSLDKKVKDLVVDDHPLDGKNKRFGSR